MRVLFVTSEVYPLAKSGGLGDVSRALPIALRRAGMDIRILMPGYNSAVTQLENPRIEEALPANLGEANAYLISGTLPASKVPVYLIYAPGLYARCGGIYQDASSHDWKDNPRRFAYLARVAAFIATGRFAGWKPDVIHANDWHTGLVPLFVAMEGGFRPPTVFTIHNLAFQGNFAPTAMEQAGIPWHFFKPDGVEFYGRFSFLKAGLRYADRITTVSPTYSREILTPGFGCGFEGLLKSREADLTGILNGIDEDGWNPATDPTLIEQFSPADVSGKRACKIDIQRRLGLEPSSHPLLGFTSRITSQKMAGILADAIPRMLDFDAKIAVCGDGDPAITESLLRLAARFPGRVAVRHYNEALAHQVVAGADILLCPARFEPCGLTQIYGLRYGALPVVRRTGGLADTVTDASAATLADSTATGFAFDEISRDDLLKAVSRAIATLHAPHLWRRMQKTAMSQDFGWRPSTARYISVYRGALNAAPLHSPLADFEQKPSPNTFLPGQGARTAKISEDAVRKRSYEIWQREGRPDGLADQHWFRAIAELEGELAAGNSSTGGRAHVVRPRPHVTHPPQKLAAGRH